MYAFLKICSVLFLLIGSLFCLSSSFADPPLPTPVGRVVWVNGSFKATMQNQEVRSLQKQSVIYLHDTLTTDNNSEAQIVFTDNSLITFRPESKFVVDQYVYKPKEKASSVGKYVMNLLQGGFRTITGLIAKRNTADYQVNTPVATIGVRGTDYAVVLSGGHLKMIYYAGSPCLNNRKGAILCLSADTPYGEVAGVGAQPQALTSKPSEFDKQLFIQQVTIGPFNQSGSGGSNGPITSFCITQ